MILGIDVGSTHTDAVIVEASEVTQKAKTTTYTEQLFTSLHTVTEELLGKKELGRLTRIVLSTTLATNAVVENKMAEVGIILMSGPGLAPSHLTFNRNTHFVDGYVDHRGQEVAALDLQRVREARDTFQRQGIKYAGVAGKFSPRNPAQEIRAAALFQSFRHVSLGHRMAGNLNYPRRVAAAYLNAAIWEIHNNFATQAIEFFQQLKIQTPIYILKADGGTFSLDSSRDYPVQTILSGPAASIMGIMACREEKVDTIAIDIGGTTTDIALFAAGIPLLEPRGVSIGDYKTCIRGLRTRSIGIGGDSSVRYENGNLLIGPQRDGRPAALGGPSPTPTDAMIVLGLTKLGQPDAAAKAIKALADVMNLSLLEAAQAIMEKTCRSIVQAIEKEIAVVVSQPVYTIHEYLLGRQFKPQLLTVVGGPANIMAPRLAAMLNCHFYVPPHAEVANALGAARSRTSLEMTLLADTQQRFLVIADEGSQVAIPANFTRQEAHKLIREKLRAKALQQGTAEEDIEIEIVEDLEYPMVREQYRTGKNIRIKAQLRPGLTR